MRRVVVVGGGLAGAAAALACADAGAQVTLVESRERLGGLTWSFRRRGLWFDNGQHVFLRCCTDYIEFLHRVGGWGDVRLQRRLDIPVVAPGGRTARLRRDALPAPLHLARSLSAFRHLSPARRLRLVPAVAALARLDLCDASLDEETFAHWLQRHGQDAAAVEAVWDLIIRPTVNLPADEASLALATKVFQTGLLARSDGADVGWSAVPLGRLHGERVAAALGSSGVDVRTGTRAESVSVGDGGPVVVTTDARWRSGGRAGASRIMDADAVIVAVPHRAVSALVPDGSVDADALDRLGTSPIVGCAVVFDRRVTDLEMAAGVGSPVQWVFDRTDSAGLSKGQCLVVSVSAADALLGTRPETIVETMVDALAALFPQAARARVVDAVVTRERTATFRGAPGSRALRPGPVTGTPGVYLAGAWTDTGWPATMESAVRSGRSAAAAALAGVGPSHRHSEEAVA